MFAGDNERNFVAVDARTGKPLWHYPTGASIWGAAATTFMLDGRQYVIPSGTTLVAFAFFVAMTGGLNGPPYAPALPLT